jgi:hypothetical protein
MSSKERLGLKVRTGLTAGATAAAALATTYGFAENGHQPTIEQCTPPAITRQLAKTDILVTKPYARIFELDSQVPNLVSPKATQEVVSTVDALTESGFEVTAELKGRASDDDNKEDADGQRTGGFGEYQQEGRNAKLAEERANTYGTRTLPLALQEAGLTDTKILYGEHEEILLKPDEIDELTRLSLRHGLSPVTLQDRYDGILDGPVPEEAISFLDEHFGKNRGVVVHIEGERTIITQDCAEIPAPADVPVFEAVIADFMPTAVVNTAHQPRPEPLAGPQYVAPAIAVDKRPREHNFSKNSNVYQSGSKPRGRLERSSEGHQGGSTKGRKSH